LDFKNGNVDNEKLKRVKIVERTNFIFYIMLFFLFLIY
jgi:hypothetical protein